ncbi:major facilitator superfamily domain-containing protein [Diaporthe sp. PMI_573]|nr:major facilitator superfamily domain-containing protein [Diaporthaceae sp. PMI_573]
MSQKRPQIGIQEANSSSRSPSKHEGGDDIRGGQLARSQPYEKLYPSTFRVGLTIFALLIAVLCVALDSTIVSTAIPRITDDFHDLHDVGWYGSAYLLTKCAFQLCFGKVYRAFSLKTTFLAALLLFEIGSVVCATAPTSEALIIGRAVAGVGSAGVTGGSFIIIAHIAPMEQRPMYQSLTGGMFGIASIIAPLVGGALTDHISWRWCFWINLPLGAVTALVLVLTLRLPSKDSPLKDEGIMTVLWGLDPLGFMTFVSSITSLLLALEWGGTTYAWGSGQIISLFVVFTVALIAFIGIQIRLGDKATISPLIASHRTIWSACTYTLCLTGSFFVVVYFLPIYFQAVKGASALQSGIDTIPLVVSQVLAIITVGVLTSKLGYYMPFIYLSVALSAVGSGLFTTLSSETSTARLIGYQILYGVGSGFGFQVPQIAAQTVLSFKDIPTGIAITLFFQSLGGSIFVSVGNNVLNDRLTRYIASLRLPGVDAEQVVQAGATAWHRVVPVQYLGAVTSAYNQAVRQTLQIGLITACLGCIGAAFMEWKSVKPKGIAAK